MWWNQDYPPNAGSMVIALSKTQGVALCFYDGETYWTGYRNFSTNCSFGDVVGWVTLPSESVVLVPQIAWEWDQAERCRVARGGRL